MNYHLTWQITPFIWHHQQTMAENQLDMLIVEYQHTKRDAAETDWWVDVFIKTEQELTERCVINRQTTNHRKGRWLGGSEGYRGGGIMGWHTVGGRGVNLLRSSDLRFHSHEIDTRVESAGRNCHPVVCIGFQKKLQPDINHDTLLISRYTYVFLLSTNIL